MSHRRRVAVHCACVSAFISFFYLGIKDENFILFLVICIGVFMMGSRYRFKMSIRIDDCILILSSNCKMSTDILFMQMWQFFVSLCSLQLEHINDQQKKRSDRFFFVIIMSHSILFLFYTYTLLNKIY